jgi:hypothetical protein
MSVTESLKEISARYNLGAVYAFDSRAAEIAGRIRGTAVTQLSPESDVDIGVQPLPGHRLTAQERVRLSLELEEGCYACRVY